MIRHIDNRLIKGWDKIAESWGWYYGSNQTSQAKQAQRFFRRIRFPVINENEVIYINPIKKG